MKINGRVFSFRLRKLLYSSADKLRKIDNFLLCIFKKTKIKVKIFFHKEISTVNLQLINFLSN